MKRRLTLVDKLLALRRTELDRTVGSLTRARSNHALAEQSLHDAREERAQAVRTRTERLAAALDAQAWADVEQWLAGREGAVRRAAMAVQEEAERVELARAAVEAARRDVDRIAALRDRLLRDAARVAGRRERREEDEHAARRAARRVQA